MFQVLLVDDEPLVRHNLWTLLDWNEHGFQLCGQAHNGFMALAMMEQSPPHIAIIDVNMPGMNGVELNRAIKERFPAIKTIMLSSFDDYDYVRESLKNGSIDYVLKHRLDGATLIAILNKAVLALRQEDRLFKERIARQALEERINPVLIRDYVVHLIRGGGMEASLESETFSQRNNLYPQTFSYTAAAVQIIPFRLLTESYSDVQTNRLVQQVVDMMQQSLGDIHERTAAYVEDGRFVVVFANKERSEFAVMSEADGRIRKIQHALELFLNLRCVTAIGHVCTSLSQLGSSYSSAERELDASSVKVPLAENTPPRIMDHAVGFAGGYKERVSLTIEEHKQLLLSIERLDTQDVQALISSIFASISHQPIHSHTVQIIVSELMQTGDKALKTWMPSIEAAGDRLPARTELGRMGSVGELEQWLLSFYADLLGLLKQNRVSGAYSRHVTQAIHFILERYPGYVTLELAAGAIGLNSSYLSRIFKEETQRTFSEYLNRVRIDAGCKLMESGRYTIKEISNQVGFTTHNYFFKVFKEITGMTPQEYLNSLGKG